MVDVGFHASHEQFSPGDLLRWVRLAEEAGFRGVLSSDHFHPWSARQGQSGFAWSWLGAALQATRSTFGVVTSPMGYRYHPAVVAQAVATLGAMYPGRFWAAFGTGEYLNEHIVGERWPPKAERNARLAECVDIVQALLEGQEVTRAGPVQVDRARVWTRPGRAPPLFAAAVTPETARFVARWADGLVTVNQPLDALRRTVAAFKTGGGGGRPVFLQAHVSWAEDEAAAERHALDQWGTNVFPGRVSENLAMPEDYESLTRFVGVEDVREFVHVSADVERHVRWLEDAAAIGFDRIFLHNVGPNQEEFIRTFGARALPALHEGEPVSLPTRREGAPSEPPARRGA